jgi:hypothetical protein
MKKMKKKHILKFEKINFYSFFLAGPLTLQFKDDF